MRNSEDDQVRFVFVVKGNIITGFVSYPNALESCVA